MQIFLSYDSADARLAKALLSQLSARGFAVWARDQEILPGDNFGLRIGEALQRSRAMVVVVSPDSMRSEYVRREIEYALGNPNYEGRIFPVLVRPTKEMPWVLRKFKSFDVRQSVAKISRAIANDLKRVA